MNIKDYNIVLSKLSIYLLIPKIAEKINKEYNMFTSDLIKLINVPIILKFVKVKSYVSTNKHNPKIQLLFQESDIFNENILIIDTIIDSGDTIRSVTNLLTCYGPTSIKTCALIKKNNEKNKDINVDFCGVYGLDGFLFGYGTDLNNGSHRNLTDIYSIKE